MKDDITQYIKTLREQSRKTIAQDEFRRDPAIMLSAEIRAATLKRVASELMAIINKTA